MGSYVHHPCYTCPPSQLHKSLLWCSQTFTFKTSICLDFSCLPLDLHVIALKAPILNQVHLADEAA